MKVLMATILLLAAQMADAAAGEAVPSAPGEAAGGAFASSRLQLSAVTLVDQHGREQPYPWGVGEKGLLVMTFGYAGCQAFCPMGNAVMARLQAELGADIPARVRLVSVSIDPRNDTPEVLRETAARFGAHEDWLWLTGDSSAVDRLLRSAAVKNGDPARHEPVFLVGDPRSGRFYRSQSLPTAAELLKVIRSFPQ
jgi:protein SCO1